MQRFALSLALVILATSAHGQSQAPSPYYPAPPPVDAPKVEQGQPLTGLSSPLDQDQQKVTRTVIDSDAEARSPDMVVDNVNELGQQLFQRVAIARRGQVFFDGMEIPQGGIGRVVQALLLAFRKHVWD